jgi:hypothetical protein
VFIRDGVTYEFHHLGIPTNEARPNERYSPQFAMHTSDSPCQLFHVQFHRFDSHTPMHPLIRSLPHAAFKVNDLQRAVAGYQLLLGPYEPIAGFRVAIVDDGGMPVELIQTTLTDDEIWNRATSGRDAPLYGESSADKS